MNTIKFSDINLLDVGNTLCLTGTVWSDNTRSFIVLFPEFSEQDVPHMQLLPLSLEEWEKFLRQSDILETEILVNDQGNIKKAVVRKSQRVIDARMQWICFQRDQYTCQYCGQTGIPLTVDHIQLWEEFGPTIEQNLLTACKKCNKTRGNMKYEDWLSSPLYKKLSINLPEHIRQQNITKIQELPQIQQLSVAHVRSR